MKFLHTADLHLGKVLHEISLLEDQKHILKEIIKIAENEQLLDVDSTFRKTTRKSVCAKN